MDEFDERFKEERQPIADLEYARPLPDEEDDEENIDFDFEEDCTCIHNDSASVESCVVHSSLAKDEDFEEEQW